MMKLVAAMAFAAVISTPALAQYNGRNADQGAYAYQYGRTAHGSKSAGLAHDSAAFAESGL